MTATLQLDTDMHLQTQDYDAIQTAIQQLTTVSQGQFEEIKKEKWYHRVFDLVTFSQKGKKRLANQIGTLAQAQQIFMELLLRLSITDAKISQLVAKSFEDIRKLQTQDIYLLNRIQKLENVVLGIRPDTDIQTLSDREKQILSACLYLCSEETNHPSDAQQIFANAVISYISTDTQMENPLAGLNGMENEAKRKILTCCMEYIFLQNNSFDDLDSYESLIDEFDFGNKTINGIKKQISSFYKLRGIKGFYSKYQPSSFAAVDNTFVCDLEDTSNEEIVKVENIQLEDEYIKTILHIRKGETKTFQNKRIHISAYINCEGSLELENCVLYYNESIAGDEITLDFGAKLSIINSKIVCKGSDSKIFITGQGENTIVLDNDIFIDCSYFLDNNNGCTFYMTNCNIINCYDKFIAISIGDNDACNISHNIIVQRALSSFNEDLKQQLPWSSPTLFTIYANQLPHGQILFNENVIVEFPEFKTVIAKNSRNSSNKIRYLYGNYAKVTNCTIKGISGSIWASWFSNCKFDECTSGILVDSAYGKIHSTVDNCVFVHSSNCIRTEEKVKISNCQFISCNKYTICGEKSTLIEYCQFMNIDVKMYYSYIQFSNSNNYNLPSSELRKCIFNGAKIDKGYLIQATTTDKPTGLLATVADCDFMNCTTNDPLNTIIKEDVKYVTMFGNEKITSAISVYNCRGLDKVNRESDHTDEITLRTTSADGSPIGATLSIEAAEEMANAALNTGLVC